MNVRPITIFTLFVCAQLLTTNTLAQNETGTEAEAEKKVRIAVLYKDTPTGRRHAQGILEALKKSDAVHGVAVRYSTEDEGVGTLMELTTHTFTKSASADSSQVGENAEEADSEKGSSEFDIVIGPTESGVFVRALAQTRMLVQENPPAKRVPVISALATADVGNNPDGWFFRTNVDAGKRADTIYNFINKYWVRSICVLYADTEFGRRAESEFEKRLTPFQKKNYTAILYEDPPNVSSELKQILSARPEAVGLFCEREDIEHIYRTVPEINPEIMSYKPLVFTVLDARSVAQKVQSMDMYCVSVTNPKNGVTAFDDVEFLGAETAEIVLRQLGEGIELDEAGLSSDSIRAFRDRFATYLSRTDRANSESLSSFTNMQNNAQRYVLHVEKEPGEAPRYDPVPIEKTVGPISKIWHKAWLILGSFGGWPILCALMMLVACAILSWLDLRQMFHGSNVIVVGTGFFFLFTIGQFLIALVLYITLAELGISRYDNWIAALALCLAPTAALKTTFFETAKGKSVGLEGFYHGIRNWVDDQLMKARHSALEAKINIVAYSNSVFVMRNALMDIYRNHPSPAEAGRLVQELEESLRNESDYIETRRICAKRLLRQLGWVRIRAEGFVSQSELSKRSGTMVMDDGSEFVADPRQVVRLAVDHCMQDPKTRKLLKEFIATRLEEMAKDKDHKRDAELRDFYESECQKALSPDGLLHVQIRFTLVLMAFDVNQLVKLKLLNKKKYEQYREKTIEENENRSSRNWLIDNYILILWNWCKERWQKTLKWFQGSTAGQSGSRRSQVAMAGAGIGTGGAVGDSENSEAPYPDRKKEWGGEQGEDSPSTDDATNESSSGSNSPDGNKS